MLYYPGNKPGFEAVNVYMRHKGGPDWTQIALRKRRFPLYDETPPVNVDVPEIREYLCKGVVDDEEIGLPSLVVEALVANSPCRNDGVFGSAGLVYNDESRSLGTSQNCNIRGNYEKSSMPYLRLGIHQQRVWI